MLDIRKLSEDTLSTCFTLEIALIILYGIVHLFCIRCIPDESGFDPELVRMWTMISFITAMSGIAVGSFGLYRMASIFDISIGFVIISIHMIMAAGVMMIPVLWF